MDEDFDLFANVLGNGMRTLFLKDAWTNSSPFYVSFRGLFLFLVQQIFKVWDMRS